MSYFNEHKHDLDCKNCANPKKVGFPREMSIAATLRAIDRPV